MRADFTPSMGSYHKQNAFKYWVQKVLPLIYDDSLSYYELLNKMVVYLNNTIEDVNQVIEDTEKLHDAYDKLQTWVNEFSEGLVDTWEDFRDFVTNYLQNLDVQDEINIKLDAMAEDGTLSNLFRPFLQNAVAEQNQKIAVLESRMNEFASLPSGGLSTSGDAELADVRVAYDGNTYPTAGDSVRGQIGVLMNSYDVVPNKYSGIGSVLPVSNLETSQSNQVTMFNLALNYNQFPSCLSSKVYLGVMKIHINSNDTSTQGTAQLQFYRGNTNTEIGTALKRYNAYIENSPKNSYIYVGGIYTFGSNESVYMRVISYNSGTTERNYNLTLENVYLFEFDTQAEAERMWGLVSKATQGGYYTSIDKTARTYIEETDTEVEDIRIGYAGTVYPSAGDAVRSQCGELKNIIENNGLLITTGMLEQGSYSSTGATTPNTGRIRTKGFIPVESGGLIKFTAGANTAQIFYGKFNSNKQFIGDGNWGNGDIAVDWNGYVILVFKNSDGSAFTPSEYDANTLVMSVHDRANAGLQVFASAENPMNPLLFDMMYFRKGSAMAGTEYLTNYDAPRFINDQFGDLNGATPSTGTSGYLSFRINNLHQPKVLSSGETYTYFLIAKTNKPLAFTPRLSTSTTWSGAWSVATANRISLSPGFNCVKMDFTFDHVGSVGGDVYKYFVLEGNTVFSDLEAEFSLVHGDNFLGWIKENTAPAFDTDLLFWGDSLTAGAGGGDTSYPKVCSEELGLSRINAGVGGESANTISARQGGNNIVIPAGAVNGTYATLSDIFGASIQPLLQGNGAGSGNALIIDGQICTLSHSSNGYTISGYTGEATTVPKIARFRGSDFTGKVVVIFVGQNGATFTGLTDVNARIAIIDSMIKHIGHDRYVIMGLSTGTNASREADDNQMLAHYGNKFFPTRKLLVDYGLTINGLTPTTQDRTDVSNGTVPTSLRSDGVHMNAYGYTATGKMLADKIRSLGYVD